MNLIKSHNPFNTFDIQVQSVIFLHEQIASVLSMISLSLLLQRKRVDTVIAFGGHLPKGQIRLTFSWKNLSIPSFLIV